MVKNMPTNAGDVRDAGSIWGQEDLLEEGMTIHSSILAWRIPWTKEPGELWSIAQGHKDSDMTEVTSYACNIQLTMSHTRLLMPLVTFHPSSSP